KLDDAIASLQKGRAFADYSNALSVIASSPFSSSRWSTAASLVRGKSYDDQGALRSLLGITNDMAWDYVKKDPPPKFIPERDLPAERDIYDHLNDDPSVNADHKRVRLVLDGQNAMEWIITGPLTRVAQWKTIRAYDPTSSPNVCTFELRQYGFFDGKYKWSPA